MGQEAAPKKCVLLSTSRKVRSEMKGWVVSDAGDRWTVRLDVRDLGGHLDTTLRLPRLAIALLLLFPGFLLLLFFLQTFVPLRFRVLRLLQSQSLVCVGLGPLLVGLLCLAGCGWPILVLF